MLDFLTSLGSRAGPTADFLSILLTTAGILGVRVMYWRRIRRWTASKDLTLVDWRPAWLEEGPGAPVRHPQAFHIEVEDAQGLSANGWLVSGCSATRRR